MCDSVINIGAYALQNDVTLGLVFLLIYVTCSIQQFQVLALH